MFLFEVTAHLALHLTDLASSTQALGDDGPRLVAVCVVANDL